MGLQAEGTLTSCKEPEEYKNNMYQWAEIDGKPVKFVNQDNRPLIGKHVCFVDHDEQGRGMEVRKIQNGQNAGSQFMHIGGGKSVELFVEGQPQSKLSLRAGSNGGGQSSGGWGNQQNNQQSGGWGGQQQSAPQRQTAPPAEKCYADRVDYGARAVKLMAEQLNQSEGEAFDKFLHSALAAAVFNSSMYAFKDNIPLTNPVKKAQETLGATEDPPGAYSNADQGTWDDPEGNPF